MSFISKVNKSGKTSYRLELPDHCIRYCSESGKQIFRESLNSGYANIFFGLSEQFHTQSEPTYCGLSTLVMVLNALGVDPKRRCRGKWRWYSEEHLNSCQPLQKVRRTGVTLEQFSCTASRNQLDVKLVRLAEYQTLETFRKAIKEVCKTEEMVMACSFSREALGQHGGGHFSPIGAYNEDKDMILVLDVARYKYPAFWVKVVTMFDAMKTIDPVTNLKRGYVIMKKQSAVTSWNGSSLKTSCSAIYSIASFIEKLKKQNKQCICNSFAIS